MEQEPFRPDMIVAQVLITWPQTIPVFLKQRTACVGCLMAPFETLADVSENYGISIENILNELFKSGEVKEAIQKIDKTGNRPTPKKKVER